MIRFGSRLAWGDGVPVVTEMHRARSPEEVMVRLLTFTGRVTSNCPRVLRDLASLYPDAEVASNGSAAATEMAFSVLEQRRDGDGTRYRLYEADREVCVLGSAPDAVAHLEYMVDVAAMSSLTRYLLVHAGVVASAKDGILLPGPSGAGKSTLVAALCLSGFSYLSDEVAVLEGEPLAALPFLKSICLKEGGWSMLVAAFDVPQPLLRAARANGERVRYFAAPQRTSPHGWARIRYILLPVRRDGARATLAPVSRATVLAELARHSLNLPRHGWSGVETLAGLVEGAECYTLTYHDLREAVATVSDLVGYRRPSGGRLPVGAACCEGV